MDQFQAMTVRALGDVFFKWHAKQIADGAVLQSTIDGYSAYWHRWLTALNTARATEEVEVRTLILFDLTSWAETWHEYAAVRRVFKWATEQGLIKADPFAGVKMPVRGQRHRVLTRDELARLKAKATPPFRNVLIALEETGARPGEIRTMEWEHLLSADGRLFFVRREFKARKLRRNPNAVRIIPVTPRLREVLDQIRSKHRPQGIIFLNRLGKPWTKNAVRIAMRGTRRRAGIGPDRDGENVVAYTLRHTTATELVAGGLRDRALADLMGHADPSMTQRYLHLQVADLLDKFAAAKEARNKPR